MGPEGLTAVSATPWLTDSQESFGNGCGRSIPTQAPAVTRSSGATK
jgi:hypothetical protein